MEWGWLSLLVHSKVIFITTNSILFLTLNQLDSQASTVHGGFDKANEHGIGITQFVLTALEAYPDVGSLLDLLLLELDGFYELSNGIGTMAFGWCSVIVGDGGSFAIGEVEARYVVECHD